MNPNEKKAADVMRSAPAIGLKTYFDEKAAALSAAGLLVTPLHERALAACEAFSEKYLPMSREYVLDKDVWMRVHDVGRESLDAKRPKAQWTSDSQGNVYCDGFLRCHFYYGEAPARDYAAEQNAKEAARV